MQDNDNPDGEITHATMTDIPDETSSGLFNDKSEALAASLQWRNNFVSCSTASGCGDRENNQGHESDFPLVDSNQMRIMCGQAEPNVGGTVESPTAVDGQCSGFDTSGSSCCSGVGNVGEPIWKPCM